MAKLPIPKINDPYLFVPLANDQGWAQVGISTPPITPADYDSVALAYDANNNLTQVTYINAGATVLTLKMTYDVNNNLTSVGKV